MSHYRALIDTLTQAQKDVLGQIALNCDQGHDKRTLRDLERLGLIHKMHDNEPQEYYIPIAAHIAWCERCSEEYEREHGKE